MIRKAIVRTRCRKAHGVELGRSEAEGFQRRKTFAWDDFRDFSAGNERVGGCSLQRGDGNKEGGEEFGHLDEWERDCGVDCGRGDAGRRRAAMYNIDRILPALYTSGSVALSLGCRSLNTKTPTVKFPPFVKLTPTVD